MSLTTKYISTTENTATPNPEKIVLSDDAYAICEFIEELIITLEHSRKSMLRGK